MLKILTAEEAQEIAWDLCDKRVGNEPFIGRWDFNVFTTPKNVKRERWIVTNWSTVNIVNPMEENKWREYIIRHIAFREFQHIAGFGEYKDTI